MKIIVNPHKLEIVKNPVNEKEINITKCQFEFSEEITNDYVKEAYFTYNGVSYKQIIVNNECDIPYEVLENKGQVELGVVAYLLENDEYVKRYNPSPAYFESWVGSLKDKAENSEPITPSEMEQYEQALQDGLTSIDNKLADVDDKMLVVDGKLDDVDTAITQTNNLNLDVSKEGKTATVTLTKKDATTKVVTLSDGTNLMFNWEGTSLGIKTDEDEEYTYVDLQGVQGETGPMGAPFTIKKTYSSVAEMNADFNNMNVGDYVMITSSVEVEDNAKLYCKGTEQWIFITDFSGATGIQGPTGATPNIQIGTVVSGDSPSVTRTGTNENPVLNFTLEKGDKGDTGNTGATGNGISTIAKTSTSGLIDTYTITYTNGNTTTFTVTNGNGIASITKTSTSGSVDTYTITYTNGTTTTFEVTNGEVTQATFDRLKTRVEDLENNQLSSTANGTTISIDDACESYAKELSLEGRTSQYTTTGRQIIRAGYNSDTTTINYRNIYFITNRPGINTSTTYTISFKGKPGDKYRIPTGDYGCAISAKDITVNADGIGIATFTTKDTFTTNSVGLIANNKENNTLPLTDIMLAEGTFSELPFEKFTGLTPAPNPDYPQDIVNITGYRNLFDKSDATKILTGFITPDNTALQVYGENSRSLYISCKPNTKYTITKVLSSRFRVATSNTLPENQTVITKLNMDNDVTKYVATTPSDANYLIVTYYYVPSDTLTEQQVLDSIMIIEGDLEYPYVPYGDNYVWVKINNNYIPIPLNNNELCKIGNYKDKLIYDSLNERLYIEKNIGKRQVLSTDNLSYDNVNKVYYDRSFNNLYNYLGIPYCNYFQGTSSAINNGDAHNKGDNKFCFRYDNGTTDRAYFTKYDTTSLEDFKTFLSEHNVEVEYVLATPTYIDITPYVDIRLFKGINNISNSEDTNMELEYYQDLSSVIGSLTSRVSELEE